MVFYAWADITHDGLVMYVDFGGSKHVLVAAYYADSNDNFTIDTDCLIILFPPYE